MGRRWVPKFVANRPLTRSALAYAERWHAGQCRADGTPYFDHSLEVARLLYDAGAPDHLVAAGLMHDVVEKTDASAADLEARFGGTIADLVLAVSDDDAIDSYGRRKAALRRQVAGAGDEALSLFAADKLSKVRELRRELIARSSRRAAGVAREPRARRMRHYQRSLALLEERLPDSSLVQDLREELNACLRERAVLAPPG